MASWDRCSGCMLMLGYSIGAGLRRANQDRTTPSSREAPEPVVRKNERPVSFRSNLRPETVTLHGGTTALHGTDSDM